VDWYNKGHWFKERCKGYKTDAARLEAERDSLKVQLKGKAEMAAGAGFKAKVDAAVKSRLKSEAGACTRSLFSSTFQIPQLQLFGPLKLTGNQYMVLKLI